jgi:L-2-hydroxyglutarate oxidase
VIVDKEADVATHQTGRNSGVIHSGVYYAPGSFKAELCVRGARMLYAYCAETGIPAERCGKVIVAVDDSELARLDSLAERAKANGVEGAELIGQTELARLEPHCTGVRALWVPSTGIVDFGRVARAYADDVRAAGGQIRLLSEVTAIQRERDTFTVETTAGSIEARAVLVCAGVYADRLARKTGGMTEPAIVPFRGDYWLLRPDRRYLAKNLIYPVPDPAFPFLGVHFTRRIADGAVWLGPNAVLALGREGYRRRDVSPGDLGQVLRHRGFRRLARRYWRTGLAEVVRDLSTRALVRELRRYVPEVRVEDVLPGPSGIRAQALDAAGTLIDDFVIDRTDPQLIHVRNAPSPAATSSLAIAELIADAAMPALKAS